MFSKWMNSTIFLVSSKRMVSKAFYYSSKKIDTIQHSVSSPFCLDCRFYIPMEHSPLYPNSACKYFPLLKPCTSVRADEKLCGKEGKYYFPRINLCEYEKKRVI